MSHSATTVYMGSHGSNVLESDNWPGDPATFKAGMCVHLDDDGDLDLASANGGKLGISMGNSLSDTKRVTVARKGKKIPILLTAALTPVVGAQVQISTTTGKAVASGTAVNAVYVSSTLTAYDEAGALIADGAAYIDFIGGL